MTIAVVCLGPILAAEMVAEVSCVEFGLSRRRWPDNHVHLQISSTESRLRSRDGSPRRAEITLSSGRVLLVASLPAGCRRCSLTHGLP